MNANRVHAAFLKGEQHKMPFTNSSISLRTDNEDRSMIRCDNKIFDKYNVTFILIYIIKRTCIGYLMNYLRV